MVPRRQVPSPNVVYEPSHVVVPSSMAVIGITETTDCPKSDCVHESASHATRNRVIHSWENTRPVQASRAKKTRTQQHAQGTIKQDGTHTRW